jgi:hypothetical protein
MAADLVALAEGLQALPLPQLIAMATGVVFLAALVMRILGNKFHGKAPPIEEGIPFVGGLIKFSKVSYYIFFLNNKILLISRVAAAAPASGVALFSTLPYS